MTSWASANVKLQRRLGTDTLTDPQKKSRIEATRCLKIIVKRKFLVKEKFRSNKFLIKKKFGQGKFWSKTNFGLEKLPVKKKFVKNFFIKSIFGPKNVCSEKKILL